MFGKLVLWLVVLGFLFWMVKSYWPDGGENDSNQTETIESSGLLSEQGAWPLLGSVSIGGNLNGV